MLQISVEMTDRNGADIALGDVIELFDWGRNPRSLGTATLIWDDDEGRVSTEPVIVEDAYDFWCKALPRCQKIK